MKSLIGIDGAMNKEWEAWQAVCTELRQNCGIEINDEHKLNALLGVWGERLAFLRCQQEPRIRQQACQDALEKLERVTA